jgi:hypothetical protein
MSVHALTPGDPLVDEVQSFVAKRAELARKVAEEIKATEKKLSELRKTAAMLSPEGAAAKERKPKQSKARAPRREDKAPSPAPAETVHEPAAE